MTFTDPLLPDTDGNGINDGEEDLDGDGLSNLQEISLGTSLTDTDTDGDGLCDGEEVLTHGTDPLQKDTDGDGLSDYDDIFLGFSPLLADTDQNGIPDGEEKVFQSVEQEFPAGEGNGLTKVGVSMDTAGNLEADMEILNMNHVDLLSSDVAGLIGVPVEINTAAAFETAQLTFYYDEASLGDAREGDLAILWYDKANNYYQVLDSAVDTENNTVTYATTHFSTYMLVNRKAWRDTWKTTMISKDKPEGESEKSFDIVIIVEADVGMAKGGQTLLQNSLVEFIDTLQKEDEAAIVSFVGNKLTAGSFTSSKLELKNQINSLESNIGVNEDIALAKAVELLAERDSGKQGVIFWVSEGYFNYNQTTVDSCIRQSIPVYTAALLGYAGNWAFQNTGEPIGYNNLVKLSLLTGGKCYPGERGGWHNSLMPELHGNEINIPDTKDSDGDGLTDSLEMAGIQPPNGIIVYTDPYKADTDGDGLTDFQETGAPHKEFNIYLGGGTYAIAVVYPSMKSNPVSVDSDGDGKKDNEDEHPWIMCHETVALLGNRYEDVEYLKIKLLPYSNDDCLTDKANPYLHGEKALYAAGGNQNWWDDLGNDQWEFDLFDSPGSQYYRLHYMGCGVTAMCDMELYMAQQNPGYHTTCGTVAYDGETGIIQREDYRRYVEQGYAFTYEIPHVSFMDLGLGLLPDKMVGGMHTFLWANRHPFTHVEWAPYPLLGKEDRKKAVLNRIKDMLDKNIPVVFSYYSSDDEDEINMYHKLNDAEDRVGIYSYYNSETNLTETNGTTINGHYMTIIGLYRYLEGSPETELHYEYIMKVVSWGGVYYIRYDEYTANLDLFTNILAVY